MPAGVRLLRRRTVYTGKIVRLVREELAVGGRRVVRDTILHPGAVVIVPVLADGRVVLVRQYRRAVNRVLLELPAGTLGAGERPLACARRELAEETGWRARRWRRLLRFYAAPGVLSERMTVYLATDLRPGPADPEADEGGLTVAPLPLRTALRRVHRGAIRDAKTIIGLLAAQRALRRR
jgi:ADP-ribose pyrophosphatase